MMNVKLSVISYRYTFCWYETFTNTNYTRRKEWRLCWQ